MARRSTRTSTPPRSPAKATRLRRPHSRIRGLGTTWSSRLQQGCGSLRPEVMVNPRERSLVGEASFRVRFRANNDLRQSVPQMRDFKIQFEIESGLRLPLIGRRGGNGFVQLLREFYSEEFYVEEQSESNPEDRPRRRLRTELNQFRFENRWPDSAELACTYCGMSLPPPNSAESCQFAFLPGYSAPKIDHCGNCGAPAVPQEEAVRRVALAEPEWHTKLRVFLTNRLEIDYATAAGAEISQPRSARREVGPRNRCLTQALGPTNRSSRPARLHFLRAVG